MRYKPINPIKAKKIMIPYKINKIKSAILNLKLTKSLKTNVQRHAFLEGLVYKVHIFCQSNNRKNKFKFKNKYIVNKIIKFK